MKLSILFRFAFAGLIYGTIAITGCAVGENKSVLRTSRLESVPVFLKGGQDLYDVFGVPIDSFEGVQFCLQPRDSVKIDITNGSLAISLISNRTLEVQFSGHTSSFRGFMKLPLFKEVTYGKVISPITGLVARLQPINVYCPIRTGEWKYIIGDEQKIIVYDVEGYGCRSVW